MDREPCEPEDDDFDDIQQYWLEMYEDGAVARTEEEREALFRADY